MKYYIVYYDSDGYYVGWKNKIEDEYSDSYHFANRYKSLIPALSRLCINIKGIESIHLMKKINNNKPIVIFNETLKNKRKRKLNNLIGSEYNLIVGAKIEIIQIEGDEIKNLGKLPDIEIINIIKKEYDKYHVKLKKENDKLSKYLTDNDRFLNSEVKTATQEDIDDFLNSF